MAPRRANDLFPIDWALELDISLRGIWKNHVTHLIRGVAEKYVVAISFKFYTFTSILQIWFRFYPMLKIEWDILPYILNFWEITLSSCDFCKKKQILEKCVKMTQTTLLDQNKLV